MTRTAQEADLARALTLADIRLTRAQTAYRNAQRACDYEASNEEYLAGAYWQDLFGSLIPMRVS